MVETLLSLITMAIGADDFFAHHGHPCVFREPTRTQHRFEFGCELHTLSFVSHHAQN
jgi:hypothetical protein